MRLRILIFIIGKTIVAGTKKTKTEIDDIFIKRTSKPLTFIVLLVGIYFSVKELSISEETLLNVWNVYYSFVVVGIA